MNQAVAYNVARWRKAAGLTQQQLGAMVGLSEDSMSEAERSFTSGRTREFDANLLAAVATALGVPLPALLLPPPGCTFRAAGGTVLDATALMWLIMPDSEGDTEVMRAYREAWNATGRELVARDPGWERLAARWMGDTGERRAQLAARAREQRKALMIAATRSAAVLDGIAAAIEGEQEKGQ